MPLNYKKLQKSGLSNDELVYLLTLQGKTFIDFDFQNLLEKELVKEVKIKKTQERYEGIRLSTKGTAFLVSIFQEDEAEGLDELYTSLLNIYEMNGHSSKIGNKAELRRRLNWFLTVTDFTVTDIETVVEDYVRYIDNPTYLTMLENLPWKPQNAFQSKKSLDYSKLYSLLQEK